MNLFEAPMQLSSVSPLQALLSAGTCFGIRPRIKDGSDETQSHAPHMPAGSGDEMPSYAHHMPSYAHHNRYAALDDGDSPSTSSSSITVQLTDAIKKESPNKARKRAKKTEKDDKTIDISGESTSLR